MRRPTLRYQRAKNRKRRDWISDLRQALGWGGGTLLFISGWLFVLDWIATGEGRYRSSQDLRLMLAAPLLASGASMLLAAWLIRGITPGDRYARGVPFDSSANLQALRVDYTVGQLDEAEVAANPVEQFRLWFDQALAAQLHEPNAMTLATVDAVGRPSARIVLLKSFDERGFVFFTNYQSAKGHDLAENSNVALLFFWQQLERQVRIQGQASRVTAEETAAYFSQRPRGARIGAWASPQSQPIESRTVLDQNVAQLETDFADQEIPPPPTWGGYRVTPTIMEFWQGRPSRLHDRLQYRRDEKQLWTLRRLAP